MLFKIKNTKRRPRSNSFYSATIKSHSPYIFSKHHSSTTQQPRVATETKRSMQKGGCQTVFHHTHLTILYRPSPHSNNTVLCGKLPLDTILSQRTQIPQMCHTYKLLLLMFASYRHTQKICAICVICERYYITPYMHSRIEHRPIYGIPIVDVARLTVKRVKPKIRCIKVL